jgi:anti-sigma B factor antagonist
MEPFGSPDHVPIADAEASRAAPEYLGVHTDAPAGGVARIRLVGELDMMTAPLLGGALERLRTPAVHTVVVDMSELGFVDSFGVATLATAAADPARPFSLTVTGCRPHVRRVFELTGLAALIERERNEGSP